jgi:hypothetical protein
MKLWERYQKWAVRQCSTAQCSPALFVAGAIVCVAVFFYMYWNVIVEALKIAMWAVVIAAGTALVLFIARGILRATWASRKQHKANAIQMATDTEPMPVQDADETQVIPVSAFQPKDRAQAGIAQDADQLADDNLELIWTADGNLASKKH